MSNEVKQMYRAFLDRIKCTQLPLQCYFEILLACYLLKFSVFIACLMTKAINSFTLLTSS